MITKELLKNEIDGISDEYLDMLYNVIKAFRLPTKENKNPALTPYQLGKDLFGKYGSGKGNLSQDYKKFSRKSFVENTLIDAGPLKVW